MKLDLIHEPILPALTKLAAPIMASMFLSTAYNLTDMAWVGMLGSEAVTAIGIAGMYTWLATGVICLARMGGQVTTAQSIGRGCWEEAKRYTAAALQLCILFGVLFGIFCNIFTKPMIAYFKVQSAVTFAAAENYIRIVCGLIIFNFLALTLTGLSTAQGDSRTPFIANLIGLVFNMVLDPVLILGLFGLPRLGTVGAAIATVSAQLIVSAVILFRMLRMKGEHVFRGNSILRMGEARHYLRIVEIGLPASLQNIVYCGISFVLSALVADFGDAAVGAQRVGSQIESMCWNMADGFASAINAFTAQNYGAGQLKRIRKGYNISFLLLGAWGVLICLCFILFPMPISRIFFHEQEILELSADYLRVIGCGDAFMCIELMTVGALSGLGMTALCSGISVLLTGMRIPLAYALCRTPLSLNGVWWAYSLSSIAKGIVFTVVFHMVMKRKTRAAETAA